MVTLREQLQTSLINKTPFTEINEAGTKYQLKISRNDWTTLSANNKVIVSGYSNLANKRIKSLFPA